MKNDPVAAASRFMAAWQKHEWARMHRTLQVRRRSRVTADELKARFEPRTITGWTLAAAKQVSVARELLVEGVNLGAVTPEMVAVGVEITYRSAAQGFVSGIRRRGILLTVVLEGPDGNPPPDPGSGEWGVNEVSALREFKLRG